MIFFDFEQIIPYNSGSMPGCVEKCKIQELCTSIWVILRHKSWLKLLKTEKEFSVLTVWSNALCLVNKKIYRNFLNNMFNGVFNLNNHSWLYRWWKSIIFWEHSQYIKNIIAASKCWTSKDKALCQWIHTNQSYGKIIKIKTIQLFAAFRIEKIEIKYFA